MENNITWVRIPFEDTSDAKEDLVEENNLLENVEDLELKDHDKKYYGYQSICQNKTKR